MINGGYFVGFLVFLLAFSHKGDELQEFKIKGYAQGTSYSITYYAKEEWVKKESVDSILNVIDQSMSLYKPNSLLTKFNESTAGIAVDFHFMKVYKRANSIFRDTEGKFDVTVAPLVQAWGFGPKKMEKFPDDATIKQLLKCVGMDKLVCSYLMLKKKNACVQVDFNGIAQGYSVDVIAEYLELHKVNRYMVEVGGELRINGTKPDKQLFKVGIEGPTNKTLSDQNIKHILQFKKGAITTSGNYQKYVMNGNQRISHLIDPKTGYPLKNEMISVTVFAKDAITADGYDNALMAMSVKEALKFAAKRKNMELYIIYTKPNGELADTLSAGFKKMIVN
jgi:thiamine biosynthesis lipoprotein